MSCGLVAEEYALATFINLLLVANVVPRRQKTAPFRIPVHGD